MMDKITPLELSIAGGALTFLLTSYFKDAQWSDRKKIIALVIVALIVSTVWYFLGNYPNFLSALYSVGSWALIIFAFLIKLIGWKWKQTDQE